MLRKDIALFVITTDSARNFALFSVVQGANIGPPRGGKCPIISSSDPDVNVVKTFVR